jgi:hypothetical protein
LSTAAGGSQTQILPPAIVWPKTFRATNTIHQHRRATDPSVDTLLPVDLHELHAVLTY